MAVKITAIFFIIEEALLRCHIFIECFCNRTTSNSIRMAHLLSSTETSFLEWSSQKLQSIELHDRVNNLT